MLTLKIRPQSPHLSTRIFFPNQFSHQANSLLPPPAPPPEDVAIASLVLQTDPQNITLALQNCRAHWTPELVDKVLKRLWNHGPKALLFFRTLDRSPTYAHSPSAIDHAVDIAGRLRDFKAVWALLHRMRRRGLGPSPKTFAIVAERYVAAGKAYRAVNLFLSMHNHGCPPNLNSFNTLLDVLCKAKHVEMAYNLFRMLRKRFRADVVSYNVIANGWCLKKRTPKALEVLKEMVEKGLTPTLTTYNILLKGFFRAGQIKEAWQFFLQMRKRNCEVDVVTYTTVVHGFGVAGEVEKAQRVFNEMIGKGVLPSVVTYNALIQVLCKKDSVENALSVFEKMVSRGYVPNLTTYNVLIRGLCHASEMERAMDFMQRMKDDGCEPNVQMYNVVIRYFCDSGEIDRALDVYEKLGSGSCLPNLDTYNILISAMFVRKKSDDLVVAGKLLIEMVDRGFLPRKFTYNRVLNGLLLTGNKGFADEILRLHAQGSCLPRHFKL